MTVLQRIRDLAALRGISLAELERQTNLSSGSITKWDKSSPSADKLDKIANFFGVSVDYLLGRTDRKDPWPSSSPEEDFGDIVDEQESDLLAAFRLESEDMSEEEKKKFNDSLKGMMKIAKGLLNDDSKWKD